MSNQNARRVSQVKFLNENQNINSNNMLLDGHKKQQKESASLSGQSNEGKIFQKVEYDVQKILNKIDQFNNTKIKKQQDYFQMMLLIQKHIVPNIHPTACTNVGDFLLRNGKFVILFIELLTRNEKQDYLLKYLYNYFSEISHISKKRQLFEAKKQNVFKRQSKKSKLLLSPQSSKNEVNWSTKVEQDTTSPFKSSVFDSEHARKSDQKLKRVQRHTAEEINEQQQKSQKGTKNIRKNLYKSTKETLQKQNHSRSKPKSIQKYDKNTPKKELKKNQIYTSQNRKNAHLQNSIRVKQRQSTQQRKLGSCYHYQIVIDRKSLNKELVQLRTSARINQSKQRNSIQNNKSKQQKKSVTQSVSKSKKKSLSKSKAESKNKKTKKRSDKEEYSISDDSLNKDDDSQKQIEWIKNHLRSINVHDIKLYSQFTALTQRDEKITKLLRQMQNSQEALQAYEVSQAFSKQTKKRISRNQQIQNALKEQNEAQNDHTETRLITKQFVMLSHEEPEKNIPKPFSQIKKQFQIQQLPLTIDSVVDPDLNNHGIYALLKLGRVTQLEMGTAYAVTPLTYGIKVNRKHIKQDLDCAKLLAKQYSQNIGYIPTNQTILKMIKQKKNQLV